MAIENHFNFAASIDRRRRLWTYTRVQGGANQIRSCDRFCRVPLDSEKMLVVIQAAPKAHPHLSNVPPAVNAAKTDEVRQLIETAFMGTIKSSIRTFCRQKSERVNAS